MLYVLASSVIVWATLETWRPTLQGWLSCATIAESHDSITFCVTKGKVQQEVRTHPSQGAGQTCANMVQGLLR